DRFEQQLRDQHNSVMDVFLPGLDEETIRHKMATFGLTAPDDLITWYGWNNGHTTEYQGRFVPRVGPVGFGFMCEQYEYFRDHVELFPELNGGWFPVVHFDGGGQKIMMDCGQNPTTSGRVHGYTPEYGFEGDGAPTLAEPIEWWCEFIDTGLWVCDDNGVHPSYDYDQYMNLMPPKIRNSCMI
ncbi:MAG: hypothetical protein QOE52_2079, partial [Mycobacterium sp.]|nr:hypothetical protein [Mycobacterium sp.]